MGQSKSRATEVGGMASELATRLPGPRPFERGSGSEPVTVLSQEDRSKPDGKATGDTVGMPAKHACPNEPENDTALARMLGLAFLAGLALWIVLIFFLF